MLGDLFLEHVTVIGYERKTMMNKFITFVILSMTVFASAAVQLDIAGGKVIVTGQRELDMYLCLAAGNGASVSNVTPCYGYEPPFIAYPFDCLDCFPFPEFDGECWYLGFSPGEAYKMGCLLQADLVVPSGEDVRSWEEFVSGECPVIRTFTEVTEWTKGTIRLIGFSYDTMESRILADVSLDSQKIISTTYQDSPCLDILLRTPNGGERFSNGQLVDIKYDASEEIPSVDISYSPDNGSSWIHIENGVLNTGRYEWIAPDIESEDCIINVSSTDYHNIADSSDNTFTIYHCSEQTPGDINNDCYVNLEDMALLAQNWLKCGDRYNPVCVGYSTLSTSKE